MSIKQLNTAWQTQTVNHTQKLVLLALASVADDSGLCCISIKALAEKCQLSRQAIINHMHALEESELIRATRLQGLRNCYVLTLPSSFVPASGAKFIFSLS